MSGFRPYDPNNSGSSGMSIAPAGDLYQAEGENWVLSKQTANNPFYDWSTDTAATDPGSGVVKGNNSDLSLITEVYISSIAVSGTSIDGILEIGDKGDFFTYTSFEDNSNFVIFKLEGLLTDNTGWFTAPVSVISSGGSFVDGQDISTTIIASSSRTRGIAIERLFDAMSVATNQNPTGTGPSNAIQVEFGPAQFGPTDPAQISIAGAITINKGGLYRLKVSLQAGRAGSGGTSEILIRALINGTQAGRSIAIKLANENIISPFSDETWLNLPAASVITYEVMRDASGADFGGLVGQDVTVTAGSWNQDVCAEVRLERWSSP